MPGRDLGEPFLDDPVKANAGKSLRGIGQRGQRMQDVAHGRGFTINTRIRYASSLSVFPAGARLALPVRARRDIDQALMITFRGIALTDFVVAANQANHPCFV